ncbi:MAG: hypothetical protein DI551_00725 [Micavibrio aeruginosavorus]|uniref:Portal protein n=1 Tax=Micavibrio aeruginosavorus TaxID=349221 RepID=A0A2W5PVQ8_9BACT|nr:MAG: hypothetical protein DI551_00725 [Micavibrio aeruginosavorus]
MIIMPQLSPIDVLKRSNAAWLIRDQWRNILEDAYELVFAGINPYTQDKKAPRSMNRQFDSTATASTVRLANRILNEMTPPFDNWADIKAGALLEMTMDKEQIAALDQQLSGVSKLVNILVNSPTAVSARSAAILDTLISGMGVILGIENPEDDVVPITDQAVSQSEVAIEVNARGEIGGIYRKRKIKVREIKDIWPDAVIPSDLLAKLNEKKDPEIEVLEVTYEGGPGSNVAWYYEVLMCAKGQDPHRMVERTYDVSPWTVFRWMVIPGMPYGPGPVLLGLADIRTANKVVEMILQQAAIAMAGMYLVRDDGVLNPDNIRIAAGGMIPVQYTGGNGGASMVPLGTNREFDLGQLILDQLRTAIKKHLYDGTLPPETGSPRSATEWIQRIKDLNQDLGVGIGMMMADVVQYVRRRVEVLIKRGMVPKISVDQLTTKVEINSPLARAQKLSKVQDVINWLQMANAAAPNAVATVANLEKIVAWISSMMGVPPELLYSEEEKKKIQQNIAAITAAQAQQANAPAPSQAS